MLVQAMFPTNFSGEYFRALYEHEVAAAITTGHLVAMDYPDGSRVYFMVVGVKHRMRYNLWLKYYYLIATSWGAIPGIIGTHVERGPDTPTGPTDPGDPDDPDRPDPLVSNLRLRRIDNDTCLLYTSPSPRD